MSLNYSFAGKRVLITGGGQGIGRQLVQRFSDGGALVFTLEKNPESVLNLRKELPFVTAEIVDLADWKATKAVIESFGRIDHLVNNAAVLKLESFMDITEESAALQYGVNVEAVINVTQTVAKQMIASGSGGTVLNISSMGAKKCARGVGSSCYGATKAAVIMLTKAMAVELGAHGIRANCILPGPVDSPMAKIDEKFISQVSSLLETMVIKRLADTNEIADLVLFLSSPLSSMITGESVIIDGGWHLS